jgi:hypothetical protein
VKWNSAALVEARPGARRKSCITDGALCGSAVLWIFDFGGLPDSEAALCFPVDFVPDLGRAASCMWKADDAQ